jgi:hypothetical protein
MSQSIDMICTLTGCNYEMATEAFNETGDVTLSVDKILFKTELPTKKKPKMDETQEEIKKIREVMKEFDKKMDERPDSTINQFSTSLSRREREESVLTPTHLLETVLQNNYSQECQLPVLEEEVEKQETACQSQSESICDLLSNGQK